VQVAIGKMRKYSITIVLGSSTDFPQNGSRLDVFWLLDAVKSELTSITKIFVLEVVSRFKHGLLNVVSVGFYSPQPKLSIG
jgi:hypothetical protein